MLPVLSVVRLTCFKPLFLMLLDLLASFDTTDHNILLQSVHTFIGLSKLDWFLSYLLGRNQFVSPIMLTLKLPPFVMAFHKVQYFGLISFRIYPLVLGLLFRRHLLSTSIWLTHPPSISTLFYRPTGAPTNQMVFL